VSRSDRALLLEYDGTLTPLALTPEQATLPASTRAVLRELSRHLRMTVAVISGRPLSELRRLVGVRNLNYIGNHGQGMWQDGRQAGVIGPPLFQEVVARFHLDRPGA
jgi:trehalose 6-phosphate phosphatase